MPDATDEALVVGYGSAGRRHATALAALGLDVSVVSSRDVDHPRAFHRLDKALATRQIGYVVIANETARHLESLAALAAADFRGLVLVEKPMSAFGETTPSNRFKGLFVGYQLRFHPVVQRLRARLRGLTPIAVHAHVGQHLASWRPQRDYRESYSSRRDEGGGALRDLSHEIDLLLWLFGDWQRLTALGGRHGALEIDSDDAYAILIETQACPLVTLQLNYLDRLNRREFVVAGIEGTLHADLLQGNVREDGEDDWRPSGPTDTTQALHSAVLSGEDADLCTPEQGQVVMGAIAAIEQAARERIWIAA